MRPAWLLLLPLVAALEQLAAAAVAAAAAAADVGRPAAAIADVLLLLLLLLPCGFAVCSLATQHSSHKCNDGAARQPPGSSISCIKSPKQVSHWKPIKYHGVG
jgi:hypothetical protein